MRKNFKIIILILAVAAFVLRLGVSAELAAFNGGVNPVLAPPGASDMFTYQQLAKAILDGNYGGDFYYQPFYYAVFLVAVKYIFGTNPLGLIALQSLLGALCVYLSAVSGALIRGRRSGLIAAVLCCFCNTLVVYTPFHLMVTLMSFWLALILFLVLKARRRKKTFWWAICGVVCAMAILTRGNIWFIVPIVLYFAVQCGYQRSRDFDSWKRKVFIFVPAVAFLLMLIIPQVPFAWHNSMIHGRLCGPSTAAGAVLALGNTPESPPGGRNPGTMAGAMEYPPSYAIWMMSRHKNSIPQKILQWFCREPAAFCELMWRKALLFWDYRSIPNNIDPAFETQKSFLLRYCAVVADGAVIALALAGVFSLFWKIFRKEKLFLLFYMLTAYFLAVIAFYNLARFRAPALVIMAIWAGMFIDYAIKMWVKNKKHFYFVCAASLIAGVFISFSAYDHYRGIESSVMRIVRPDGIQLRTGDGRVLLLDNGPKTFGSWQPLKLEAGQVITKIFPGEDIFPLPYSQLVIESRQGKVPGRLRLNVNGAIYDFSGRDIIRGKITVQVPENHNRCVQIKVLQVSGDFYVFLDAQRNYQRTFVDGEAVPAELVGHMYRSFIPHLYQ